MDVAFPADRRRVAEPFCHNLDCVSQVLLDLPGVATAFLALERDGAEHCAGPSSEVLSGDILAADFAQVIVDVARGHVLNAAFLPAILQQVLARELLTGANNSCDA